MSREPRGEDALEAAAWVCWSRLGEERNYAQGYATSPCHVQDEASGGDRTLCGIQTNLGTWRYDQHPNARSVTCKRCLRKLVARTPEESHEH